MRENGLPDFPDPEVGASGELDIRMPAGSDPAKTQAALDKCKAELPNGGATEPLDPKNAEKRRKFANCMRDNGVPNFPDPDAGGGAQVDPGKLGFDPNDPKYKAAEEKCRTFQPAPTTSGSK